MHSRYDATMTLLSLLFALLIEQVRPLKQDNWVLRTQTRWAQFISKQLDAGHEKHTGLICGVWCVLVLYATLGFRQFSHHFTDIKDALEAGDEVLAREKLAQWKRIDTSQLNKQEITSLAIEYSVLAAHQHVFGVLFWFAIGAAFGLGPCGAVIYRLSHLLSRVWHHDISINEGDQGFVSEGLSRTASLAWSKVDWLSARVTALSFAVVGNFEDAIECWRNHSALTPEDNDGVVLCATSGALKKRRRISTWP